MNDTVKLDVQPAIAAFVEQVRARLADLDAEERAELTDGLEADLGDLVAERGPDALGDPAAYAEELRSAAGFSPVMGRSRDRRALRDAVADGLDGAHAHWNNLLDALPSSPRPFLESIQPAWWVLRAVVAWLLAQGMSYPLFVFDPTWSVILLVFVVVSVQLGRGAWRTGDLIRRSVLTRLGLVGLNAFAAVMIPVSFAHMQDGMMAESAWQYYAETEPTREGVLTVDGAALTNLFPYDAQGRPLSGVQLYDREGRPVNALSPEACCQEDGFVGYPWLSNGEGRFNVFPLPEGPGDFDGVRLPDAWSSDTPPELPSHPLTQVPSVTLPTPSPTPAR